MFAGVKDRRDVIDGVPKAVSPPGHGLDLGVNPLERPVRESQIDRGQDPGLVPPHQPGEAAQGREPRVGRPVEQ